MRNYGTAVVSLALSVFAVAQVARPQSTIVPARLRPGNPGPKFPKKAQEEFVAGPVVFRANVTPKGRVDDVAVLQVPMADLGFEQAAEDAIRQWRFDPATLDGEPVSATYVGSVGFSIDAAAESSLSEKVVAVIHDSRAPSKTAVSGWLDDKLGHLHSSQGIVRGALAVATQLDETGLARAEAVSVDRFKYYSEDLVSMSAALRSADGALPKLEVFAVRRGDEWLVAHLALPLPVMDLGARFEYPRNTKGGPPEYPDRAKKESIAGRVVVEYVTNLKGDVSHVFELIERPFLSDSLGRAARRRKFQPATLDGEPLSMWVLLDASYSLRGSEGTVRFGEVINTAAP